jgi:protein AroM
MKARIGMVTIGQAPRVDVVPDMADILGPGVEILERGALDGLDDVRIAGMAPAGDDEVLVTRLSDGRSVFVAKRHVTPLVQQRIEALERDGAALTVLLCTGKFQGLRSTRPLVEPDKVILGVLRGVAFPGRLGVLTPSERQVPQTAARWKAHGFDALVVGASPYHETESIPAAVDAFRAGGAGFVLMDCIGFRREARDELRRRLGVPVVVANLLVARVVAELAGA